MGKCQRPKICYLAKNKVLRDIVGKKISKMSTEQISGWFKKTFTKDNKMNVPYETIYKRLFVQTKGIFRKNWLDISDLKELCDKVSKAMLKKILVVKLFMLFQ